MEMELYSELVKRGLKPCTRSVEFIKAKIMCGEYVKEAFFRMPYDASPIHLRVHYKKEETIFPITLPFLLENFDCTLLVECIKEQHQIGVLTVLELYDKYSYRIDDVKAYMALSEILSANSKIGASVVALKYKAKIKKHDEAMEEGRKILIEKERKREERWGSQREEFRKANEEWKERKAREKKEHKAEKQDEVMWKILNNKYARNGKLCTM